MQQLRDIHFHPVDNDQIIAYSKTDPATGDTVLVVCTLDSFHPQAGNTSLDMPALGLDWNDRFLVRDEVAGGMYNWGQFNFVRLEPWRQVAHIFLGAEAVADAAGAHRRRRGRRHRAQLRPPPGRGRAPGRGLGPGRAGGHRVRGGRRALVPVPGLPGRGRRPLVPATFEVLAGLAGQPGHRGGHAGRPGAEPHADGRAVLGRRVPGTRRLTPDELPPGYVDGLRTTVPSIRMPDYLAWLLAGLAAAGVPVRTRELTDLDAAREHADLVVNATGLGARELVGDRELTPVRGQVVRVRCPAVQEWTLDEGHPDGPVYVIPRGPDVICGGTADEGAEDLTPDPDTAAAILARCRAVVPELADAEVLGHAVGLRPVRSAVRLERVDDVVHCYGHGGSGVTVSWGCADEVARLAG